MSIRQDLTFVAYAIHLGFTVDLNSAKFVDGVPSSDLRFSKGCVHVWSTSLGWRVGTIALGRFVRATDGDFFKNLRNALEEGARRASDTEAAGG